MSIRLHLCVALVRALPRIHSIGSIACVFADVCNGPPMMACPTALNGPFVGSGRGGIQRLIILATSYLILAPTSDSIHPTSVRHMSRFNKVKFRSNVSISAIFTSKIVQFTVNILGRLKYDWLRTRDRSCKRLTFRKGNFRYNVLIIFNLYITNDMKYSGQKVKQEIAATYLYHSRCVCHGDYFHWNALFPCHTQYFRVLAVVRDHNEHFGSACDNLFLCQATSTSLYKSISMFRMCQWRWRTTVLRVVDNNDSCRDDLSTLDVSESYLITKDREAYLHQ
jgi:hypothetical protein